MYIVEVNREDYECFIWFYWVNLCTYSESQIAVEEYENLGVDERESPVAPESLDNKEELKMLLMTRLI